MTPNHEALQPRVWFTTGILPQRRFRGDTEIKKHNVRHKKRQTRRQTAHPDVTVDRENDGEKQGKPPLRAIFSTRHDPGPRTKEFAYATRYVMGPTANRRSPGGPGARQRGGPMPREEQTCHQVRHKPPEPETDAGSPLRVAGSPAKTLRAEEHPAHRRHHHPRVHTHGLREPTS